jgi:hypothetical protein
LHLSGDFPVDGGRGPGLCPGVHFRRTRLWIQATGEWRAEGSSLDRDDGLGRGRTASFAAIFGSLTSIRNPMYNFFARGGSCQFNMDMIRDNMEKEIPSKQWPCVPHAIHVRHDS